MLREPYLTLHSVAIRAWLVAVALVCGCVVHGVTQQDLQKWGLARVVIEDGTELSWPAVASRGDEVQVDPARKLGAAVIVSTDARPGTRARAAELVGWLQRGTRLPRERVLWLHGEAVDRRSVAQAIAQAATQAERRGTLVLVFIGEGRSHLRTRQEQFFGNDGTEPVISQAQTIEATLLGHRSVRTLAVWDACGDVDTTSGWVSGIAPRTYQHIETDAGLEQRRANITTVSSGVGSACIDQLPGGSGPALSYWILAGLQGWADANADAVITSAELGAFTQRWARAYVSERDAVTAHERHAPEVAPHVQFVAVARNWHSENATTRAPSPAELVRGPAAPQTPDLQPREAPWAGGAIVRAPSVSSAVLAYRDRSPGLSRLIDATEQAVVAPPELADAWCRIHIAGLADALEWECRRRRAFAHRWTSFAPILDRDAAALRDVFRRLTRGSGRAARRADRLLASFLATYEAYPDHPKVRAMRAVAALDPRARKLRARTASRGPMLAVENAWFPRGCGGHNEQCEADERPLRRIYVSAFDIQEYEVSLQDYDYCVRAGVCEPIDPKNCYHYDQEIGFVYARESSVDGPADGPVSCVTWPQATAYCGWIGGRLPTEAEWERAARGDRERAYPWSDSAAPTEAATCDHANSFDCGGRLLPATAPLAGRSPVGAAHLAGNAAEWVHDFYGEYGWHLDPKGPISGRIRSVRGGSFAQPASDMRTSYRYGLSPQFGYAFVGFRCAAGE